MYMFRVTLRAHTAMLNTDIVSKIVRHMKHEINELGFGYCLLRGTLAHIAVLFEIAQ